MLQCLTLLNALGSRGLGMSPKSNDLKAAFNRIMLAVSSRDLPHYLYIENIELVPGEMKKCYQNIIYIFMGLRPD